MKIIIHIFLTFTCILRRIFIESVKNCGESKQLLKHEVECGGKGTMHKFPGGTFRVPQTVFEQLEEEGFLVPESLRYYPYRAVFDFECYFESQLGGDLCGSAEKLVWEDKHVPLSASVCSNVPVYLPPRCFVVDKEPQTLVQNVVDYLSTT